MSRFLVVTNDTEFERRVRTAVHNAIPGSVQQVAAEAVHNAPRDLLARSLGEPTDVILLGSDAELDAGLKLATALGLQHPDIGLVAVAAPDPEYILNALRAGVRDIAPPDAEPAQLRVLLERACQATESRRRGAAPVEDNRPTGRIIPVMSPKGGVGKTSVATNLAVGLAKFAPMGVVIVDLDLQFGDVASALNIDPEHTVTDAVSGAASQDSMVLKAFLSVHESGAYALCGPRNPADAELVTPGAVALLLTQLAAEFQYVIVDTAPGLGEHVLAALELSTDGIWVLGMDIPSVRGLHSGLAILRELELVPANRHLVLNFADRHSGLTVQDIEETLGLPIDVLVPRSRAMPLSTNKGAPLLAERSNDPAWKGLSKLVDRFTAKGDVPHRSIHRRVVLQ